MSRVFEHGQRVRFGQMRGEDDELRLRATQVRACTSLQARRAQRLSDDARAALAPDRQEVPATAVIPHC